MRRNHVTIVVSDLERSKAFYRVLGLIQIVDTPPRYARFRMPDGDATPTQAHARRVRPARLARRVRAPGSQTPALTPPLAAPPPFE